MEEKTYILCLGMFDGVHAGHQALLRRAKELSGGRSIVAVCTFLTHPAELFRGGVTYLSANGQRETLLKAHGADEVMFSPFTEETAAMSPEEYIRGLVSARKVAAMVAGFNYTFGAGGRGTGETLRLLGDRYGFHAEIVPPVMCGGEPVSSSRIRECLRRGELQEAETLLTRPYALCGTVKGGRKIGRSLGFPTANLDTGSMLLPPDGVYASVFKTDGKEYGAVTNIGTNPTVHGAERTVETHIMHFSGNLYEKNAETELISFLRGETAFPDENALKERILLDVAEAERVLALRKK